MGDHARAKLFMHGRSQAVRLPKEFRFEGSEVEISRQGDKVVLTPLKPKKIDWETFLAELDAIGPEGDITLERDAGLAPWKPASFD